jgi:hypothetical protein
VERLSLFVVVVCNLETVGPSLLARPYYRTTGDVAFTDHRSHESLHESRLCRLRSDVLVSCVCAIMDSFTFCNSTMQADHRTAHSTLVPTLAVAAWARTHTHPGSWAMATPEGHPAHPAPGLRVCASNPPQRRVAAMMKPTPGRRMTGTMCFSVQSNIWIALPGPWKICEHRS